ncbi:MAG: hypothetical protein FWE67_12785, partial [Planctomycetaceae bacterium]|nr:hypothetical protein [Planctomycetaceae bacterium]
PDIDSAAKMNWKRAEKIRTAADVIVAVLTQEKYNDAAVRRFYREAAAAKKPVIVLFNMLDLDEDVQHIPRWIEQFITETKVQPLCILAVPHSRTQAENLTLPFHEVLIQDDKQTATLIGQVNFNTFLSELKFNDIKTQTLLGALDVLNDQSAGISAYLARIETAAKQFAEAQETLKHNGETTVEWAFLPSSILAEEIRLWWSESRPDWSKTLNSFYRKSGQILLFPIKKVGGYISTEYLGRKPVSPVSFTDFEKIEREAAVELCENMFQKLERLAASYNPVLKRELSKLLTGEHRVAILETAHKVLSSLEPVNDDFRVLLRKRLDDWKSENPQTDVWLRRIDNVMSAAHPLLTGVLVLGGSAVVGLPVFGSMIAGGVITTYGGETLLAAGSEGIAGGIAKLFRKIQKDFVTQRCQRFCAEFNKEIWDDVNNRLKNGTEIVNSEAFQNCKKNISALRK